MFDSPLIVKFSWIKVTWEILSCNIYIYIYMYELLLVAISIIEQFERDDRNRREGAIVAKIFQSLFEIRLNHRGWERRVEGRGGGAAKRKRRSNGNEREQFSRPRRDSYFHLCACVRACVLARVTARWLQSISTLEWKIVARGKEEWKQREGGESWHETKDISLDEA